MKKELLVGVAWALGLVLLALGATYARSQDVIGQDEVLRIVIGANGLMIAFFGNRAPKVAGPNEIARRLARVSGWSFVVSGLIYTALWALAPISVAITLGSAVIAAGMLVTIFYCFRLRARVREQGPG